MKPHKTIPPRFNAPTAGADPTDAQSLSDTAASRYAEWCGKQIADRFVLDAFVGTGTFGAVFRGSDLRFPGRVVAVKVGVGVLKQDHFFREARLLGQLNSEFVVSVYDYGEHEGVPYIVMEFLHGQTLAELLKDSAARLPPELIAQCIDDVGRALVAMHAASLIHRDLKPENIMLVESADSITHGEGRKRFKIIDFGISSKTDAVDSQRNATFDGAGTPEYMAPEQLLSAPVTAQADIYALGVLTFLLHSGRVPFHAAAPSVSGLADLVNCVLNEPAPPLSDAVSEDVVVPEKLNQLVADCLAKNATDRPASAADVCKRYRQAIQELHSSASLQHTGNRSIGRPKRTTAWQISAVSLFCGIALVAALVWSGRIPFGKDAGTNSASNHLSVPADSSAPSSEVVAATSKAETAERAERAETSPSLSVVESTPENILPESVNREGIPPKSSLTESDDEPDDETDVAATPPMTETDVEPIQKPVLWCPSVFEPTGEMITSGTSLLANTLRLKDPEIEFVLVTPETLAARNGHEPPTRPFYISRSLVSRKLYDDVAGLDPFLLPIKTPTKDETPEESIALDNVDVDALLNIIESTAKQQPLQNSRDKSVAQTESSPVTDLTWFDSHRFCLSLTVRANSSLPANETATILFRLPQHQEWWAAVGYFSGTHADKDPVNGTSSNRLKDPAASGFEWTSSTIDANNRITDSIVDHRSIKDDTRIVTPGQSDQLLTFGMIGANHTQPAGQSGGSTTAFRVVLQIPDVETAPDGQAATSGNNR